VLAKQAAARKKLVDTCVTRYSTSGYGDSGPWAKYVDVQGRCERDPNTEWSDKATPLVIEIRGGETLKIIKERRTSTPPDVFDLQPILYLGHNQKFTWFAAISENAAHW